MKVTVYFTLCPMCLSARGVCLVALEQKRLEIVQDPHLKNKTKFNPRDDYPTLRSNSPKTIHTKTSKFSGNFISWEMKEADITEIIPPKKAPLT